MLCARGLSLISSNVDVDTPMNASGHHCLLANEHRLLINPADRMSAKSWTIIPTSFVRAYLIAQNSVVIVVRVKHLYPNTNRFHSVGLLDQNAMSDPKWFPQLSQLWHSDSLSRWSLTCSSCGPSYICWYHCSDPNCHQGRCFRCYSDGAYPGEPTNYPLSCHFSLPSAVSCTSSHPHGPKKDRPDLSFVLAPLSVLNLCGLGTDEKKGAAVRNMHSIFRTDRAFTNGCGVYSLTVEHPSLNSCGSTSPSLVFKRGIERAIDSIGKTYTDSLFIHLSGHMSSIGYHIGGGNYSCSQIIEGFFVPLIQTFRSTCNRSVTSRVFVYLNICDVIPDTWATIIRGLEPELRFETLLFTNLVLIDDMSYHVLSFLRDWVNTLRIRLPGYTSAHSIHRSMSELSIAQLQPTLITMAGQLVREFVRYSPTPAVAPPLAVASSVGSFLLPPFVMPPSFSAPMSSSSSSSLLPFAMSTPPVSVVQTWTSFARNKSIQQFIDSLPHDERVRIGVTVVTTLQLFTSLNLLTTRFCPSDKLHNNYSIDTDNARRTFSAFRDAHWSTADKNSNRPAASWVYTWSLPELDDFSPSIGDAPSSSPSSSMQQ